MGRGTSGFSLVEATIVMTAVALLSAVAAPSASRALDRVRMARAIDDMEALKTAMFNFRSDVFDGFTEDGTTSGDQIEMLVSDGDTPLDSTITDDNGAGAGAVLRWDDPVGDNDPAPGITVDFFEGHLVTNSILNGAASYGLGGGNAWRGTYMNAPIDGDPWGNRYASNVKFMDAPSTTSNDVFVLSVGPDEEIDTPFEKNGIFPGDDDIIVMLLRDNNATVP